MNTNTSENEWRLAKADVFWAEIAPCEHILQIYEDNETFMDILAGFAGGGINAGDSVIIIATKEHLKSLEERLMAHGIHVNSLISNYQYIPLIAEEVLSQFMVNGWPDEDLFMGVVKNIIRKARKNNKRVRAFGEMVALLWAQGYNGATVQLEHLWNKFCAEETLCLFCAYPKSGFTQDAVTSMTHICCSHSKIIKGTQKPMTEILYKGTNSLTIAN